MSSRQRVSGQAAPPTGAILHVGPSRCHKTKTRTQTKTQATTRHPRFGETRAKLSHQSHLCLTRRRGRLQHAFVPQEDIKPFYSEIFGEYSLGSSRRPGS